jgi:capsular exopolysaccharide synthesis family protein
MDLADHLRVISANWWRILLIAALVGVGVFVFSYNLPNTYEGFALVNVAPEQLSQGSIISQETMSFRVAAYSQLLKTRNVAEAAAAKLRSGPQHYGLSAGTVRGRLGVIPNDVAGLIGITASAHSQQEALDIANAYAQALNDASLQQAQADLGQNKANEQREIDYGTALLKSPTYKNDPVSAATIRQFILQHQQALGELSLNNATAVVATGPATLNNDGAPVAPRPSRDGLLAFLVAFVVTAESFVVARALSDRFARAADVDAISELTGLPVLALVPRGRGPVVIEAFRTLRTNLMFLEGSGRPRTIAVVSPNPGAGKSFTVEHLAEAAVAVDAQVVVIDADLRRPVLHDRLDTPEEPGLTDALRGGPVEDSLHKVPGSPGMHLIPSGAPVSDTVAALGGRNFRHVLDSLDAAELVIVDTPPGSGYADALAVSAQCDAALLVLDAGTTRRRATKQFVEALERTGASLIGVVLNGAQVGRRDGYYGYERA